MTKTEIKIKLRSLIKSGDFELLEQLLEGLNDVDYYKYSLHCLKTNFDKMILAACHKHKHIHFVGWDVWHDKDNTVKNFTELIQTKYNNMCAEAIETTESTGRE